MSRVLKSLWQRGFPERALRNDVLKKLMDRDDSYLRTTGWLRGLIEKKPVDGDGEFIPWMNYSFVAFLKGRLAYLAENKPLARLFEYGAGYSSLFFSKWVERVVVIEHDSEWLTKVQAIAPDNIELVLVKYDNDGEYCRAITKSDSVFDVVVVDGRDRVNSFIHSFSRLDPAGVIIFDDTERAKYGDAFRIATEQGFRSISIEGLKPGGRKIQVQPYSTAPTIVLGYSQIVTC